MRSYEVQGDQIIESDTCAARRALEAHTAAQTATRPVSVDARVDLRVVEVTVAP